MPSRAGSSPPPSSRPGWWTRRWTELDFLIEHGARVILMRPAPAWGYRGPRSFALPEFDPYWTKVEEAGCWSSSTPRTPAMSATQRVGGVPDRDPGLRRSPSRSSATVRNTHRDIQDAVTSMICHGALWRASPSCASP